RQPFDLLAETTAIAARSSAENNGSSSKNEIWLWQDDASRSDCLFDPGATACQLYNGGGDLPRLGCCVTDFAVR
ncbi:MAG: hypothetical protein O3B74_04985, partial [Proteobacteria bacterium]|nr:hypothetical protein [Pseudomonadota bacterium]